MGDLCVNLSASVGVDFSVHFSVYVGCNSLQTADVSPCSSPLRDDFYLMPKAACSNGFFPLTGRLFWRVLRFD